MTSDSSPAPVLIVGSMAFDDLELPTENAKDVVGGSATYAGLAVSLFAPARVVAVVGDDFPESAVQHLRDKGVDCEGIERANGKTFRWAGRYSKNLTSRETLDTQLNVFADFRPKLPPSYRASPFLLLGNIHPSLQLDVLAQVDNPRLVAADTMNFWISGERPTLTKLLAKIDTLVINDEELRQLAEDHNVRRAAAKVRAMGPSRLVVKRGEYGAMLFDEHGMFFTPSFPLDEEIDPTGAGDTFAGALLGYLSREGTIDKSTLRMAMMVAATVASFSVEGVGTKRLSLLDRDQVAHRLAELRTLVHFGS
jgi:sugar/nucleoside kinase (ribokinase family)